MNSTGLEPATEEEMRKALFGTLNKKASGVSGLGPVQLKAMKQSDSFVKYLTQAYNELTTHPEAMSDVTAMFEFRAILIPKESDGYPDRDRRDGHEHLPPRPAEAAGQACQLPLMRADRLQAERIRGRREEGPRAHQQAGMHAASLDIKNAFNSLPRAGVPKVLIDYIRNFLDLRHSRDVKCEVCGVPQGDPLSMFLFCMATERLLRRLKEGHHLPCLADDIVALHDEAYPAGAIVQQATVEAAAMDLTIRSDKCKSTMAGEEVTFLNHPVSPTPASPARKAIAGAETALRKIERTPITIHQKLILLSLCVVPMVNYAPLVEITSDKADYEELDRHRTRLQQANQQKLRSPGRLPGVPEGEGRPGPAHAGALPRRAAEGMGLPGRQQGDQRPGGAAGGRPGTAREGDLLQPPPHAHTPASGQSGDVLSADVRRANRGGKGPEGEGRLDRGADKRHLPGLPHGEDPRPRHELPESGVDQDHEARHDRRVPVPPRLREVQRRAGNQDPQPPQRPEPEARHLARRQVQGDRCGCHPAPPDGCLLQREGQEVQGRDAPDHLWDGRIPPPQVQEAPRGAPRGPLSGLPSPSPTWLQRRTST
ncbi:Hypothetical protein DHA2_152589 [Giardia duodenalis]|uniref:Reverse transcriptase domain-containing protein n=1 Tax=Giardia intestinalis TaxID=5741 RepID=V6TDH6_GIAIN|nr:Hypothetical protein DHA2_152589 [Giardia intestinalis]